MPCAAVGSEAVDDVMMLRLLLLASATLLQPALALHGRFLTLSDLHPDWNYVSGSSINKACHRGGSPKSDSKDLAGYWGSPVTDCDAPASLIEATMHEIESKWKDKVDFAIVMGDFARHDSDSNIPRTLDEIVALNANITSRLQEALGNVPMVPSIGNNDVWPHNILRAGPTQMTTSIAHIWPDFIPEEQFHTFARGGYYAREVIPDQLVVVALNTIYWFSSNHVVDGCPAPSKHRSIDPGMEQLRWLNAQLEGWRVRGMQVILSGHVPPLDYYEGCYTKFAEICLAYQDTIIASVYGHKNVDTFSWMSHADIFSKDIDDELESDEESDGEGLSALAMPDDLRSQYESLPRKAKEDNYAITNIAPSIIPTYIPAYRLWTYNTTDSPDAKYHAEADLSSPSDWMQSLQEQEPANFISSDDTDIHHALQVRTQRPLTLQDTIDLSELQNVYTGDLDALKKKRKHKKGKKGKKKKKQKQPTLPRHTSPDSPSRSNKFLTPLGYTQFYLPLDEHNENDGWGPDGAELKKARPLPQFEVEYTTMSEAELGKLASEIQEAGRQLLRPDGSLKRDPALTPYQLPDLTIGSWLKLARMVTESKSAWKEYEKRIYVSALG